MANSDYTVKFEPDEAETQDEKRLRLIELLTGVWQFDDIVELKRMDEETKKGWESQYRP